MILNQKVLLHDGVGEKDLVVIPRKNLYNNEYWSGFRVVAEEEILNTLNKNIIFCERTEELEKDESLKQVIPYFLVKSGDKYLVATRKDGSSEARLHGERTIGFGGHLRSQDIKDQKMNDWLKREFEEEVNCDKILSIKFLGLVNDDSDEKGGVSMVHIGLVFEIETEGDVSLKEADKFHEMKLMTKVELQKVKSEMGAWSRILTDYLWGRDSKKGQYIVFEGIVGSGKTTQSKLIAEKLHAKWTREPGGSEIADAIRKVVQGTEFAENMDPVCEAYLYASSRAQTLRSVVKPELDKGKTVVSDRSLFTSLTYQAVARGLGVDTILEINKVAVSDIWPDIIFYLDLPPEIALARCSDAEGDKFEKMGIEFFNKCRKGYLELAQRYPKIFVTIDGQGTIEEVFLRIYDKIKNL